ncbi:MAG: mechanosensitive ion channel [Candidatus Aminicenantes bacterium]|nr:mechanosensitive ion channel [Candidatus Aminicenantes bacterium]
MNKIIALLDAELIANKILTFLPDLVAALFIMIVFWIAYRISRKALWMILERAGFHENLIRLLIDNAYKFVLMFFSLVMAGGQIGINIGAMLAGFGVVGIAIGFAAQDSIANTIAGFLIFWDKPFEFGDWISVADQYGQVTRITLRSTRIRTNNNTYVVIPNKNVIDQVLVNHSKHGATRIEVPIGIAYKENIRDARDTILKRMGEVEGILKEPAPDIVVTQLGSSSVDMFIRVWIDDAKDEKPIFYRVMEESKMALDAAGIEIPYHHLQLFIENVEDRVWEKARKWAGLSLGA